MFLDILDRTVCIDAGSNLKVCELFSYVEECTGFSDFRLIHGAHELDYDEESSLMSQGIGEESTVSVQRRLRGGGADGGTQAVDRKIITKLKKADEKISQSQSLHIKWCLCALSSKPLTPPVVACPLGRLFNKDELVLRLAERNLPEFPHIKGLKDMQDLTTLKLTPSQNPDAVARFMCPITLTEMYGKRFVASRPCGCVYAEKTIKLTKSEGKECVVCNAPITSVLSLNPADDEVKEMKAEMERARKQAKKEKKGKKEKKRLAEGEAEAEGGEAEGGEAEGGEGEAGAGKVEARKHRPMAAKKLKTTSTIADPAMANLARQARSTHESHASDASYTALFSKAGDKPTSNDLFICPPRARGEGGWLF